MADACTFPIALVLEAVQGLHNQEQVIMRETWPSSRA